MHRSPRAYVIAVTTSAAAVLAVAALSWGDAAACAGPACTPRAAAPGHSTAASTVTAPPIAAPAAGPPGGERAGNATMSAPTSPPATTAPTATGQPAGPRDPLRQPFASTSIWNTPIGSGAVYERTYLRAEDKVALEPNTFAHPARAGSYATYTLRGPDGGAYDADGVTYGGRCRGTANLGPVLFPRSTVIGDAVVAPTYASPGNATAVVYPDGRTLLQLRSAARCGADSEPHGNRATEADLYGDGTYGGHAGSGLSSIGGQLAPGELSGPAPIAHALQLGVWAQKYLAYEPDDDQPGFRWPADRNDADAATVYCTLEPCRDAPDRRLKMGALLAINPSLTMDHVRLTNPAAIKIFEALRDFGGYVVADTYAPTNQLGIDAAALNEVDQDDPAWRRDVRAIFNHLWLVDNNAPDRIGGGGTPRVAPPAPLPRPATGPSELPRTGWVASASHHPEQAAAALDADPASGWRSRQRLAGGQWFQVDLGAKRVFSRLTLDAEAFPFDYAHEFDVLTSADGNRWTRVTRAGGARSSAVTFPRQNARYLRLVAVGDGIEASQTWSIGDLRLWRNDAVSFR
ncbi:discoidin domain-containing protein [Luedemannella helvata]|uniref:F5/8 type C domain-containing protein n=1 Tax=Luedemannella helvata TaxID=349315 RepID=A0ABN2JQK8_9ACTN